MLRRIIVPVLLAAAAAVPGAEAQKLGDGPWSETFTMAAKPEWDSVGLFEYVCEENNRCPGGKCQAP